MHYIPLFCSSSPCNLLFLNLGVYGLVQATVGVGTVLIWDFGVAYRRGGGGKVTSLGQRRWEAAGNHMGMGEGGTAKLLGVTRGMGVWETGKFCTSRSPLPLSHAAVMDHLQLSLRSPGGGQRQRHKPAYGRQPNVQPSMAVALV